MSISALSIKGKHNTKNAMAAAMAAQLLKVRKQNIKEKKETINVKDKPPHAPVSTQTKPNSPPEIK